MKTNKERSTMRKHSIPHWLSVGGFAGILTAFQWTLPGLAQGQLMYTTENGAITITGGCPTSGDLTIPETINGLPVTRIGDSAFEHCQSLTSIILPNSITSIGDYAFALTSLTSLTIPDSVTSIGGRAFMASDGLTNITIPDSVTSIGFWPFAGCTRLTAIEVDPSSSSYSSLDGVLLDKSQTLLIACPGGKTGAYVIPNSVTGIGDGAFTGCSSLTSITIPNSVISIGVWAFSSCTSLTRLTIPDSVTSIGEKAFWYCTGLKGMYFQGNAPNAGVGLFEGADDVAAYYLPGTTGWASSFEGRPTALWTTPLLLAGSAGVVGGNGFALTVTWSPNASLVVDACADLASPVWSPISTNTPSSGSWTFFDPDSSTHPKRFYRVRSP